MRRYADVPMDYADATLVTLGDALRLDTVFTTDRRGFEAYRGARGTPFTIIPKRAPWRVAITFRARGAAWATRATQPVNRSRRRSGF